MKKWPLVVSAAAIVLSGAMDAPILSAAAKIQQITADVTPFNWKAGDATYSSTDGYNDGTQQLPGSINYKGTTYIPVRLLTETLGYDVDWDDATKTATILDPAHSDDPAADFPTAPEASYIPNAAAVKSAALLLEQPDGNAKVVDTLPEGSVVSVKTETDRSWLKVTSGGKTGYISASATDYRYSTDRPAWERKADAIITEGLGFMGRPYQFGASAKQTDTFDCSSFTKYLFGKNGVTLPRVSRDQSQNGTEVATADLRKGDLIFFTTPQRKQSTGLQRIGHVAIYVGDNKVLHTYRVGIGVTVTELDSNWKSRIVTSKRVIK